MKKLATTFGLLALMLIVTSFTTPQEIGGKGTSDNGGGAKDPIGGQFEIGGKGTSDNGGGTKDPIGGQFEIGGKGTSDNGGGTKDPIGGQ